MDGARLGNGLGPIGAPEGAEEDEGVEFIGGDVSATGISGPPIRCLDDAEKFRDREEDAPPLEEVCGGGGDIVVVVVVVVDDDDAAGPRPVEMGGGTFDRTFVASSWTSDPDKPVVTA